MINERMIEFLLLKDFIQGRIEYNTTQYDKRKLKKRFVELKEEFLKPYAF